ncbi:uncharacterized protein DSM5745_01104 [Aspergillus mulundensis]|uniref:FAD-binding PCMH-type domain-containing protein n=1 Tax=Aspergillus mulundensis TaxID=1810919 RepID=A0A3D8T5E7_9EURO|nr:Uncharacterized protein DSM5745_01104 [Aspergillus mulundensis]RDW93782.1 Uncharacterized protein DSM5745_01104 [Aspergillus mulundensis]
MRLFSLVLAASFGAVNALIPRPTAPLSSVSQAAWEAFNETVGGRLYNGEPVLAPCYPNYNGEPQRSDAEECTVLQSSRNNGSFTSDNFGAYRESNWAACQTTGEGCTFDVRLSSPEPSEQVCYQGSVSPKYVDARSVEDIQATLEFAKAHHLRLVIKNTGHDYSGHSSGVGSLGLWTHHIRPSIELETDFIPDACTEAAGDAITFGAGQQFAGVYEFAHQHNYRVVGGSSQTVGVAGGWIAGGGHSMLSNELGLGADNTLQLKVVLPNGTYVTANRCQNQDIFFALRGGGGGTFGVVTEMSMLVHPEKPTILALITFPNISSANALEFLSITVANANKWASEGWGGYIQLGPLGMGVSTFFMSTSLLDQSAAEDSMKPVTDFATSLGSLASASVTRFDTYYEVIQALIGPEESSGLSGGGPMAISSRIVPQESFEGTANQEKLTSILNGILLASQSDDHNASVVPSAPLFICVTAPTIYSQNLPESDQPGGPGASSVTPAWRNGLWHSIYIRQFADSLISDPDAVRDIFQEVHDRMDPLREFTPHAGAYLNEADSFETDPIASFWGEENYARLLEIKEEVDPTNLLSVHQGVGWESDDERFRCYPEVDIE